MKLIQVTVALSGFLLLVMLASAACSDGSDRAAAPGQSLSQAEEEQLGQTVVEAQRAFLTGEAKEAYAFFASDYQERCSFEEFSRLLELTQAIYGSSGQPEIAVEAIRLEGEKAFVDIRVNGQVLDAGSEPDGYPYFWILEDGEWKRTSENPAPCELPVGTPLTPGQ